MKTTIDIPDAALKELLKHTGAPTKRDAVVEAVNTFNKRRRLAALAKRLQGSMPNFMTQEELRQRREDTKWEQRRDSD
jgi:hypothetical protein